MSNSKAVTISTRKCKINRLLSHKQFGSQKDAESSIKIHVGPCGGSGGSQWDDESYSGVQAITLHGLCIDSIRIEYDENKKPFLADKHGEDGGNHSLQGSQKEAVESSKKIHVGPWGGYGGSQWDDGSHSGVRAITLNYGECIDSIRIEYDKNGKPFLAEKHGGDGGNHSVHITLKHPDEYLTMISGHISKFAWHKNPVIRSLVLTSNQRTFGPFGVKEGTPFTFAMEDGMIVGFRGKSGWYLDAIGVYVTLV